MEEVLHTQRTEPGGAELRSPGVPAGPSTFRATSFHVLLRSCKALSLILWSNVVLNGEECEGGR